MTKKTDGGPAFPVFDASQNIAVFGGMSMRDHFAGQALAGLLACGDARGGAIRYPELCNAIAEASYAYADAMLAERAK